jgi:hypothetical protein
MSPLHGSESDEWVPGEENAKQEEIVPMLTVVKWNNEEGMSGPKI